MAQKLTGVYIDLSGTVQTARKIDATITTRPPTNNNTKNCRTHVSILFRQHAGWSTYAGQVSLALDHANALNVLWRLRRIHVLAEFVHTLW